MPEFKRYPKGSTRTLIDFERLISRLESAGDVVVCVPVAVLDIMRKLLRDRGLWRTTYAIEFGEIGYTIPSVSEFEPLKEQIESFLEETNEMRCDDIISSLQGIAQAITASSCCNNAGPGYVEDGEGGVFYGTEAPVDKPVTFGGPSDAFATEAEFQAHLCAAANNIVAGLVLSLNNWSVATLASLIAGGLVVAFFVATPPLAIFIALAAAGFAFGAFHTMSNYIDTNRDEWVCAIYMADSYSDMLVRVDTLINEMVISLDIGVFEVPITDIIHAMLSTDVFNQAYTAIGLPEPVNPVDCGDCFELPDCLANIQTTVGEIVGVEDNGDGTWWVDFTTQYLAGEDHEVADFSVIETAGPFFTWVSPGYQLVSGAAMAAATYYRQDNTSGSESGPTWPAATRYQIKRIRAWASASTSPNSNTRWRFKLSCAFEP